MGGLDRNGPLQMFVDSSSAIAPPNRRGSDRTPLILASQLQEQFWTGFLLLRAPQRGHEHSTGLRAAPLSAGVCGHTY